MNESEAIYLKKSVIPKRIISFVFYASVFVVMAAIIMVVSFGNRDKNGINVGPFSLFTVLTGSMSPTFDAGSVIITQKTDADKLQVGDILTYKPLNNNVLVTHRIVDIIHDNSGYSYITRGDANNVDDITPVSYESTVGRVIFWVNGVGIALLYIRTPRGIAFIGITIILLFYLSFLFGKLKSYVPEKKSNDESC